MKQFGKILKFELNGYLKNKIFVGVTLFLMLAIAVVMFFPNIRDLLHPDKTTPDSADRPVMLIYAAEDGLASDLREAFAEAFADYDVQTAQGTLEDMQTFVKTGVAECAFALDSLSSYTYYVNDLSQFDYNRDTADAVLQEMNRAAAMVQAGLSPEQAGEILSVQVTGRTETLGKDQGATFLYTYVMIFALYMVIMLYGQMVATNVATEKSSRAMEVLITSANPVSMMFGKVLASCLAGLGQLVAVFGTALVLYRVNKGAWGENPVISYFFDIPTELFVYLLVFFVLGFLLYAFLYGAIGSTASKLEDINTSVMPVTFLFIAAFIVVAFSVMGASSVDSTLMKVCSFLPFSSPMAMFARICMSEVPAASIALSIGLLAAAVVFIGVLAAKIYRVGVLLYGTTPKLGEVVKAAWKA